jgi:hypothetical protein
MKRRGILAAILAAPMAALFSSAQALGIGRARRRTCPPAFGTGPHRDVGLVKVTVTPNGNKFDIKLTCTIDVPDDVTNVVTYLVDQTNVRGSVVDEANHVTVIPMTGLTLVDTTDPQKEGDYVTTRIMQTLMSGYSLVGYVDFNYKVSMHTSGS